MLNIFERNVVTSVLQEKSENGDFDNPIVFNPNGDYGDKVDKQLYLTNDDGNNWYFSAIYEAGLEPGDYYVKITGYDGSTVCADFYVSLDIFEQATVLENFLQVTNGIQMMWDGDAAFTYQVQYSGNLVDTQSWTVAAALGSVPVLYRNEVVLR